MTHYDKQRHHKVEYKEYTLEDYKKLNKEVRLGGLGPDFENESLKQKVRADKGCGDSILFLLCNTMPVLGGGGWGV